MHVELSGRANTKTFGKYLFRYVGLRTARQHTHKRLLKKQTVQQKINGNSKTRKRRCRTRKWQARISESLELVSGAHFICASNLFFSYFLQLRENRVALYTAQTAVHDKYGWWFVALAISRFNRKQTLSISFPPRLKRWRCCT